MSEYRVLSNGDHFIVQRKFVLWPFWLTMKNGYTECAEVYVTLNDALKDIDKEKKNEEYRRRQWRKVWP